MLDVISLLKQFTQNSFATPKKHISSPCWPTLGFDNRFQRIWKMFHSFFRFLSVFFTFPHFFHIVIQITRNCLPVRMPFLIQGLDRDFMLKCVEEVSIEDGGVVGNWWGAIFDVVMDASGRDELDAVLLKSFHNGWTVVHGHTICK